MSAIYKHVYAASLEGAKTAAELGNFLVSQAEINAAERTHNLYAVRVEINVVETVRIRPHN